jgi:hypothetical protein
LTAPPDADAPADSLGCSDAAWLGATLGALDVVVPPPLEQAASRMAAVAPSDSSRIELRNVNSSSMAAGAI